MNTIAKQFSVVAFLGLVALTISLGYGALIGDTLSTNEFVTALRHAGIGFMLGGLSLWVAQRRYEAQRAGLNPLFVSLVIFGCLTLIVGVVIAYFSIAPALWILGVAVNAIAIVGATLVTIVNPAFAEPVTKVWPEGGDPAKVEAEAMQANPAEGLQAESAQVESVLVDAQVSEAPEPEDLTQIEGIGSKAKSILHESGILTFAQVAAMSAEDLMKTLKEGGFRAPFNPETWPEQASLAANGDWDTLKKLQDSLSGGQRK